MKLDKLKMPEKKKKMPPMDLKNQNDPSEDELNNADMGEVEGSPEEEAQESPADEAQEGPNAQLEQVSDDDLMAEIKKRGLMDKLNNPQHDDMYAQDEEMNA